MFSLRQLLAIVLSLGMLSEWGGTDVFGLTNVSALENPQRSQCGINSLYFCLKYHGWNISLEDLYASIHPDSENNVSLKELGDYAKRKGLYVSYTKTPKVRDIQHVLQGKHAVLLQYKITWPDNSICRHLVALIKPDTKILLLDYPNPPKEILSQELSDLDGKCEGMLILAPKPILDKKAAGAGLMAIGLGGILIIQLIEKNLRKKKQQTLPNLIRRNLVDKSGRML